MNGNGKQYIKIGNLGSKRQILHILSYVWVLASNFYTCELMWELVGADV